MTLECERIQEHLGGLDAPDLERWWSSPAEASRALAPETLGLAGAAHARACPECGAFAAALVELGGVFAQDTAPLAPVELAAEILQDVAAARARERRWARRRAGALIAAAVLLALVLFPLGDQLALTSTEAGWFSESATRAEQLLAEARARLDAAVDTSIASPLDAELGAFAAGTSSLWAALALVPLLALFNVVVARSARPLRPELT